MAKRVWSGVLVASLLLAAWPERTHAADAPKTLRAAVERVVAQAETDRAVIEQGGPAPHPPEPPSSLRRSEFGCATLDTRETRDLTQRARTLKANPAAGQMSGGGMGKMLIVTLLTTAVSVGAYMYIIKKSNQQGMPSTLR
jgi:hypothetical protein